MSDKATMIMTTNNETTDRYLDERGITRVELNFMTCQVRHK
jgi:hypothetical protein